jgi:hypothetical protein
MILVAQRPLLAKFPDGLPLRHHRLAPAFRIFCFSSRFLSKYFGLRSEPIFEVVTMFATPFLEKPIRTCSHDPFGQCEGAFVGFRGWM